MVRILTIKQGYIMRAVLFISFLFVMSLGLIGGCSDGGGQNDSQALTENDFAEDSALRADLDEEVVVTFLENPMSDEAENDTGEVGIDEIPITYPQTTEQTFCWEDDDVEAMHFMELRDSEGNLILTVHVNGDCVTEVIEAGDYVISIFHDESAGDTLPIFLIPIVEELDQARKTEGLINRINVAAANILKAINKTVTKNAEAQTVMENINTLLSTNICLLCNLEDANLSGANLSGANLFVAKLNRANLSGAELISANLEFAQLEFTDLSGAKLNGAVLRQARINRTVFSGAVLSGADLRGAALSNADLSGADLSGAKWCDGCVCAQGSIGTCNGCKLAAFCSVGRR
jgi:hypothetical protein